MAQPETTLLELVATGSYQKHADVSEDNFRYANMSPEWRDELLDPAGWDNILEIFAVTLKLAVALTDPDGRMVGRCHNPQSTWLLARAAKPPADGDCPFCLAPSGFCIAVKEALSSGSTVTVEDPPGLAHVAVPLFLDGQPLGSLIAGQVFVRYPEAMPLHRVARDRGIDEHRLWQAAIAQAPVTPATLRMYGGLLMPVGQACVGERYAAILHKELVQTSQRYRLFVDRVKDFNDLLTGITGSLSFVKSSLPPDCAAYQTMEIAERSSAQAAELVAQLLAYAGKGKFMISRFDFSTLIRDMLPLLAASISKTVELDLALMPGLPWLEGDASQIRQIVMNLIINGAEAIGPEGGTVQVSTGHSDLENGIFLQVKDSGSGMSETTKVKIFDPFFSTKATGRGLGLAAVSGIVRSHKGKMTVDSIPEKGTTFTVTFPGVPAGVMKPAEPLTPGAPDNRGTVLIADDEDSLRTLARLVLENSGYSVLVAKNGREAVEMFRRDPANIVTVVLDRTMPIMGGQEASGLIREIRPEVPIIMSSGYGEVAEGCPEEGSPGLFIQKPYSASRLIESVREALRQAPHP